jgi:phenylpyruvate tautomerase PptA (4-oxalocrotonate tautomerase family)
MPTITIRTTHLGLVQRRAIAVRLTRWLTGAGVRPAQHIVVRFEDVGPGDVYTGGMPVEALARDHPGLAHASVSCCVSGDRDDEFRSGLAAEIAAALPGGTEMPFLYIEFRPTAAVDVWIARHGTVSRADGKAGPAICSISRSSHVPHHAAS